MSRDHKSYRSHPNGYSSGASKSVSEGLGDDDFYPVEEVERETCGLCGVSLASKFMQSAELEKISFKICDDCRVAIKIFIEERRKTKEYYRTLIYRSKIEDPLLKILR